MRTVFPALRIARRAQNRLIQKAAYVTISVHPAKGEIMRAPLPANISNALRRIPRLTATEERDLVLKLRRGDHRAQERLVLSQLRFVISMARRNPALLEQFISVLAHNEHFLEYRGIVQREIREQLESLPPEEPSSSRELQPV
mgnify:CR=1 FL=1